MTHANPTRREVLRAGGLTALALAFGPRLLLRPAVAAEGARAPVLVHVFLRGGMDGLSALVPYAAKEYRELRKSTAIAPPKKGAEGTAVHLDGRFGLHPALASLKAHYDAKRLAVLHAVGSPDPTRSHFDAQDYMETGTPGRKAPEGWIARYVAENGRKGDPTFRSVSLTATLPRSMRGDPKALAIANFDSFAVGGGDALGGAFSRMYRGGGDEMRRSGEDAFLAVGRLREANPGRFGPENGAVYPRGAFGRQMLRIAQLIKARVGLEVAFADLGGWDTHLNQGGATGSLANRLRELSDSLSAFATDLGDAMEDVLVVTLTEFGRTAKENGTGGTDHGHASVSFVLGGKVKGGRVLTRWPGLAEAQLWQKRDLAVTTDFRDILSEALTRHLGADGMGKVFPGHRAKKLGLIA